ncbi:VOC family protein [Ornithinimicrobium flavum]|uniref:VOC family protein n=1 Tax=Ornithinimicrobium flavum TaxID=1288636 RepID=UPI00106FDD90|nr:VOC family protein [Ornithinimicrobium flavum]
MPSRPRIQATSVSLSTPHPRRLARFYADLLGVEVARSEGPREGEPAEAGWAQLRAAAGATGMTINLEWDPHFVRPVWPSTPGEQQPQAHLDLAVDDLEQAQAWALACGASTHPHQPQQDVRVMVDPDGHPFCLFTG